MSWGGSTVSPPRPERPARLLTFELIGLCFVSFLGRCNLTAFYDLFQYLATLGIPANVRGVVVGGYSLTAMVLFVVASPFVHAGNATRVQLAGVALLVSAGIGYLVVNSFWGLLSLRLMGGAGQFCVSAGSMAALVSIIPKEKSGQAFGIYSIAALVALAAVPAVLDWCGDLFPSQRHTYAAAGLMLLPVIAIVLRIERRRASRAGATARVGPPHWRDVRANVSRPVVLLLLAMNAIYFINWTSIFFLFKGFARLHGISNAGTFYAVQAAAMILIRTAGGSYFDRIEKIRLLTGSFVLVAVGYAGLYMATATISVVAIAAVFGVGLGLGFPAINGLMFEAADPRLRAMNANLMLFAAHAGSFLGPAVGGAIVAIGGYPSYFLCGATLASASAVLVLAVRYGLRDAASEAIGAG